MEPWAWGRGRWCRGPTRVGARASPHHPGGSILCLSLHGSSWLVALTIIALVIIGCTCKDDHKSTKPRDKEIRSSSSLLSHGIKSSDSYRGDDGNSDSRRTRGSHQDKSIPSGKIDSKAESQGGQDKKSPGGLDIKSTGGLGIGDIESPGILPGGTGDSLPHSGVSSLTLSNSVDLNVDVGSSLDLQCPPCEKLFCTPRRARRLRCRGGVTRGVCNCCPVCAKTEAELCGGDRHYLGKCDRGLYCRPQPTQPRPNTQPEGTCVKVPSLLSDEAVPSFCESPCTPEYCAANPRAICSARGVSEKRQSCQGPCQHTACQACRFVLEEPDCLKCRHDDFHCIKKFARCAKLSYCTRRKFPCKAGYESPANSKFQCQVPECLLS